MNSRLGSSAEEREGAHRSRGTMQRRRLLLTFRDPDGEVRVETLGRDDDFAELVDPTDGSVRHAGPFVMHGKEWRIDNVSATGSLIRVTCVSSSDSVAKLRHRPSHRV